MATTKVKKLPELYRDVNKFMLDQTNQDMVEFIRNINNSGIDGKIATMEIEKQCDVLNIDVNDTKQKANIVKELDRLTNEHIRELPTEENVAGSYFAECKYCSTNKKPVAALGLPNNIACVKCLRLIRQYKLLTVSENICSSDLPVAYDLVYFTPEHDVSNVDSLYFVQSLGRSSDGYWLLSVITLDRGVSTHKVKLTDDELKSVIILKQFPSKQ